MNSVGMQQVFTGLVSLSLWAESESGKGKDEKNVEQSLFYCKKTIVPGNKAEWTMHRDREQCPCVWWLLYPGYSLGGNITEEYQPTKQTTLSFWDFVHVWVYYSNLSFSAFILFVVQKDARSGMVLYAISIKKMWPSRDHVITSNSLPLTE